MYGRGLNSGDFAGQVATHGGIPWVGGVLTLIVVGLVIAATIIAIILLINAARNRGVEVKGGRLAAFWFVGICLTPIMLALYVLTLKPAPKYATAPAFVDGGVENAEFGAHAAPTVGFENGGFGTGQTAPMPGVENPTQPLETRTVEVEETTVERNDL